MICCVMITTAILCLSVVLIFIFCKCRKMTANRRGLGFGQAQGLHCVCFDERGRVPTTTSVSSKAPVYTRPVGSWRAIGKARTASGRMFILEEMPHPTRRYRYMYRALSTDLNTQTEFTVEKDGVDASDQFSLGLEQIDRGSVFLPEINESAVVFVRR
jgi:hypothetical protein